MYGTIARIRPKPGQFEQLRTLQEGWNRERGPNIVGAQATYLFLPDNSAGEAWLVAVFQDEGAYRANAESPEQDAWYRRFRELLESDPEWIDGQFFA